MVFRHISPDLKERTLWLATEGYIPPEICEIFGISHSSLKRWKRNKARYGSVKPPINYVRGRPSIATSVVIRDIHQLLLEDPDLYISEILDWLVIAHGVGMSRTTLARYLRDINVTYKKLRKAAKERDEEERREWRETVQANLFASQVITVDETSKDDRTIFRTYGRAPLGQRAVAHIPFNRGQRYSIVAAMSIDGYIAQRVVPGSLNGNEYLDFILEEVVCHSYPLSCSMLITIRKLPQMNPFPQDESVLIMDNCSIHKSEHLREVVESYGMHATFFG
jgi:transposase